LAQASFDVFLSHSSVDKAVVARFADLLRARGLRPWLDVEQVVPGVRFQADLGAGLGACRSLAVFVGEHDVGAWVVEEVDAAVARAVGDPLFRVFLVLLPGAPEPFDATGLHAFLSQRTWVDLRRVDAPEVAADLLARAVRGESLGLVQHHGPNVEQSSVCPFVGLRAFGEAEAPWFFGRDADVQRMAEKLSVSPFLAVLGRSGVGKSSAVHAGLVPALAAGRVVPGAEHWPLRLLRPTGAPLEALAAQVSGLRPDMASSQILDDLASSDVALKVLTAGRGGTPLLWVVDQAEELFTLCEDSDQRRAFAANLLHASQADGPARVVVTLRSDFYPRLAELSAFGARVAQNQHVIADLDEEQLRQVMMEPAALVGLSFEAGLVARMIGDTGTQAGALPLLQHALRELWACRRGSVLTHEAYDRIGGVEGALARHADAALAGVDQAGDLTVARRLMVELVRPGDGVEDTRQPVRLSDLVASAYPLERLHRVAAALADARLVTTGTQAGADHAESDVVVELVHEALIRSWPRLGSWLAESRDELRVRQRIRAAARAWRDQGRPDDLLYRGTVLALARQQREDRLSDLSQLEAEFVEASTRRADVDQARSRRRRVRVLSALSVLTLLMVVAAAVATVLFVRARDAQREAEDNAARALAQQARAVAREEPALALAIAAEARQRLPTQESADALQVAHLAYGQTPGHLERTLTGHPDAVTAVAFNDDGSLLATASYDRTARIWNTATGKTLLRLRGHRDWVVGVAFSHDGSLVATASQDGTAMLWDATTGEQIATFDHGKPLTAVAFSPDGTRLAASSRDGTAVVWDVVTHRTLATFTGHEDSVTAVAFSPDGRRVATASRDTTARLWDPATGHQLVRLTGHLHTVTAVVFNHDGTLVATASRDGKARVWDLATHRTVATLTSDSDFVTGVAFDRDDSLIATSSADGTARLWDRASGAEVARLTGHDDAVTAVTFTDDGAQLATASADGTAKLWDPTTGDEVLRLVGHRARVEAVAFSPDGTRVATAGGEDRTAKVWDAATGREIVTLTGHTGAVLDLAFNDDGTRIATASADGTARVWDPVTGKELTRFSRHQRAVAAVAVSPNGTRVATASFDRTARLWDPVTGEEVAPAIEHDGEVVAAAFDGNGILATTTSAMTTWLWDLTTGEELMDIPNAVGPLAFGPHGAILASGGVGNTAGIWDPTTGEQVASLEGHTNEVLSVAVNNDGTLVATGSADGTAKLWDPANGDEVATLTADTDEVWVVAFSPDGTRLATAGTDGTVLIRHLVLTPQQACAIVSTEVTRAALTKALGGDNPRACTNLR
jgi:WD40 repeat protein